MKLENNQLFALYREITLPLSHTCYDIFKGDLKAFGEKTTVNFSFENDTSGDICEVRIPFEEKLQPIVFKRTADSDLLSKEYLQQFEGIFGTDSVQIEVSLRGKSLFIIGPGMGLRHELIPDRRLKFGVKGLSENQVQFALNNDGKVSGCIVVDPRNTHNLKIYQTPLQ